MQMIKVTEGISNECYLDKKGTEEILDNAEKQVFNILQKRNTGNVVDIKMLLLNL